MKDIFGNELNIGDIVATNINGYTYSLIKCEVIGFTNKKVRIKYNEKWSEVILKFPEQLAKGINK